ncbi:uncharacterized protein DEA37_0005888 [Paragonimus westermani]|uniref:Uncharacterized protein n=1 Tax=Paragonimus westermani TaxID=34504 RepID=A0A5J4NCX2_9TREM|nr:uncharacterized protein DEA37_0005888 [Paragonimus westermani]
MLKCTSSQPQLPQMICENGAPGLIMDKPEQGLDLVIECLEQQQLRKDFMLGLHLASQALFDQDKHCWSSLNELVGNRVLLATSNWPHTTGIAIASEHNPQSANRACPSLSPEKVVDSSGPGIKELALQTPGMESQKRAKNVTANDNTLCVPVEQPAVAENIDPPLTYSAWVFNAETKLNCFLITEIVQALQNMRGKDCVMKSHFEGM